ncbi:unnamed protein product [Cyprideis torosa]|uniref:WD repeat-containing protein 54 beta-propeller domain-containing protein n=1 Tax=Cyprideis torosa TaxID=163714 RepID=A0A7R8W8V4_9CRUS|nr:unnamed protein product [Cyprideis torosa]CAG0888995.1 unnamed protein product [Cyprideis torosa]
MEVTLSSDDPLPLESSASLLFDNLVIHPKNDQWDDISFGVIHKNVLCVTFLEKDQLPGMRLVPLRNTLNLEKPSAASVQMMQVSWCTLTSTTILLAISTEGIQIFSEMGEKLLFHHEFLSPDSGEPTWEMAQGITYAGDTIFIGCSRGDILEIRFWSGCREVALSRMRGCHPNTAVTALCFMTTLVRLVSADEKGVINVWKPGDNLIRVASSMPFESCVTCLKCWKSLIIAGFATGHLRIFDLKRLLKSEPGEANSLLTLKTTAESSAHVRPVSGIAVSKRRGWALTCAEDTLIRLWELKLDKESLHCLASVALNNAPLTGVAFLKPDASKFAVSVYDIAELQVYSIAEAATA